MPHLAMPELLMLLAVALLILGPRVLPELIQRLSQAIRQLRTSAVSLTVRPRGDVNSQDDTRQRS